MRKVYGKATHVSPNVNCELTGNRVYCTVNVKLDNGYETIETFNETEIQYFLGTMVLHLPSGKDSGLVVEQRLEEIGRKITNLLKTRLFVFTVKKNGAYQFQDIEEHEPVVS